MTPEQELAALRERLHGLLALTFQNARVSLSGTGGDGDKFIQQAGAANIRLTDAAEKLHEAYTAFARAQVKAEQARLKEKERK